MHAIFNFFSSLRLTVVTLTLALILVFVGTIAQVNMGLYQAQERYFSSLLIYWGPRGADWRIPVFPGGYLLGGVLVLNLIAAHVKRFEFSKKKIGIFVVHAGLILLFLGQFATQLLQVESYMAIPEGTSKNFSESHRRNELAIVDVTDKEKDKVVAIPESILERHAKGAEIRHPDLPFAIKVNSYSPNSNWKSEPGKGILFDALPRTTKMDDRDIPVATVEVAADGASKGTWTISNWQFEERLIGHIQKNVGKRFPSDFAGPKEFEHGGRKYLLMMRPERHYKPFDVTLLKFSHDRYLGTDMPRNFSSRVRLQRPQTGEDREVLIYMNNPLRYWGETYYQSGVLGQDEGTVLQVVRNPSWLTPYVACVMVGVGLIIQFMSHLIVFAKRRTA